MTPKFGLFLCVTLLGGSPLQAQMITTLAGNGMPGFSGDGGTAGGARVNSPYGVALDNSGNVLIADSANHRIRRVDTMTGIITTVAGNGIAGFSGDGGPATNASLNDPRGVATDSAGTVYIADTGNCRIRQVDAMTGIITTVAGNGAVGFSGDGGPATSASLNTPRGVTKDSAGNVFIGDSYNNRVRRVDAMTGIITTVAGNGTEAFSGDGGPATSASLRTPWGVATDSAGTLYIADNWNHRIRRVDATSGIITTAAGGGPGFIGDGGPATSATLVFPEGVALDSAGTIFIGDAGNCRIRRVDAMTGTIMTVAGNGTGGFSGDGGPATSASLYLPSGVAVDGSGNLFVADRVNNRIRRVEAPKIITTIAGTGLPGFSGDGGPATSASLNSPLGMAVDSGGNIFIADTNNLRIRRVDAMTGVITTVAGNGTQGFSGDGGPATSASLNLPAWVVLDSSGNLYIADAGNHRIRRVDAVTGIITTAAGNGMPGFSGDGPAISVSLDNPLGVAVDRSDNLFIADSGNNRIRRVDAVSGIMTTAAGNGIAGFSGDGGPATSASLNFPFGVAVDDFGNVFFGLVIKCGRTTRKLEAYRSLSSIAYKFGWLWVGGDH